MDKLTPLGKREVLRDVMGVKLEDQTRLFETMPRDLLLILKCNNLLRYVNEQLGSPVNRFRVIARFAEQGLAVGDDGGAVADARDRRRGMLPLDWLWRGAEKTHDETSKGGGWIGTQAGALLLPVQLAILRIKLALSYRRESRRDAARAAAAAAAAAAGQTTPSPND